VDRDVHHRIHPPLVQRVRHRRDARPERGPAGVGISSLNGVTLRSGRHQSPLADAAAGPVTNGAVSATATVHLQTRNIITPLSCGKRRDLPSLMHLQLKSRRPSPQALGGTRIVVTNVDMSATLNTGLVLFNSSALNSNRGSRSRR
jgi:hypothetical protein